MLVIKLNDKCKTATEKKMIQIQIWLTSSKYRRESTQTKVKGEKFMLNLKFCVEALNISGQRHTQEKKICSVLFY